MKGKTSSDTTLVTPDTINEGRAVASNEVSGNKDKKTSSGTTLATPDTIKGGRAVASNEVSGGKVNA